MAQQTSLSPEEWRRALTHFQRGIEWLHHVYDGDLTALSAAIQELQMCLEWATPQAYPELYDEASAALQEAIELKRV